MKPKKLVPNTSELLAWSIGQGLICSQGPKTQRRSLGPRHLIMVPVVFVYTWTLRAPAGDIGPGSLGLHGLLDL